ncbi:MAG: glycosyltransferase [Vicingaceae bacterium]
MTKSTSKIRVVIFIDWFYPAYKAGGPIKSVYHIAENLSQEFEFYIVCSNQDLDGEILKVKFNQWSNREHTHVIYLDKEHQSREHFQELFEEVEPQVIYYNNLFSFPFGIKALWQFRNKKNIKQIIAPRGMLGAGALKIKAAKKRSFLNFAKIFLFRKELIWHASTEQEQREIKRAIGENAKVRVARNLSSKPRKRELATTNKKVGSLKLVFISRLSPKKNLLFLLELLQNLGELQNLCLDVYGPIEAGEYWHRCERLIKQDDRISYKGILKPTEIEGILTDYHFYVLPTLHENFGHSIAEAINAGVPVLLSEFTPWRNLAKHGVGFDLSLGNKPLWQEKIQELYALDHSSYEEMTKNAYEYALRNIVNSKSLIANQKLFQLES